MLTLVSALDFTRYTPRTYIVSEGDKLSAQKATDLENLRHGSAKVNVPYYVCVTLFIILIRFIAAWRQWTVVYPHRPQGAPSTPEPADHAVQCPEDSYWSVELYDGPCAT